VSVDMVDAADGRDGGRCRFSASKTGGGASIGRMWSQRGRRKRHPLIRSNTGAGIVERQRRRIWCYGCV